MNLAAELQRVSISVNANLGCCGLYELSGLEANYDPALVLAGICARQTRSFRWSPECYGYYSNRAQANPAANPMQAGYLPAQFVFTQATKRARYGTKFMNFINENKLGTVVTTGKYEKNPNSGRFVLAFIWTPDKPAIIKWWADQIEAYKKEHVLTPAATPVAPVIQNAPAMSRFR
jgi:hypothetical protein